MLGLPAPLLLASRCYRVDGLEQLRALLKAAISTSIAAPETCAKHHDDFGQWEATPVSLIRVLGIDGLVFGGITH